MKRLLLASFVAFAAFALTTSAKITSATYNLSAFVPSGSNLILGKQPSYSSNAGTHAESTGGLSAITDGRVGDPLATDVCAIGANGVLEYTLGDSPNGYNIKEIRFYTYWPDSTHNGIQLADFSTKTPGNNTFSHVGIDGYNLNYGDANARAFVRYHRSNAADNLVTGVSAIRFDFGDLSTYGGLCPIVEIEVIGQSYDYPSATLTSIFADSSSLHFVGSLLTPASGATSAGSTLVPAATVSRDQRTITFSGSLAQQGANDTTVWLYAYIGDAGDTFAPMGDPVVIHPGDTTDFSVPVTVPAFDDRVVGYFVCSNACGTVAWGDRTSGSVEIRARDFANYQWKPEVAEGDWADPANWIPSKADNVGYPGNPICDGKYASAGFDLCAGKTIVVNMAASYNLAGTSYLAENASITLVKASNATPVLTNGETFDLRASDLTLTLDGIDVNNNMWTLDNNSLTATNVTLRLTNGARVVNSAYSYFCGHGYRLLLDHGSFYGVGRTLSIGGRDMVVDIDDSQVYAGWLVELDRTVHGEGHAIHFRGDHPQLFTDRNMGLATGTYGCSFVFHVPAFGYTAVPVRSLAAAGAADTVAFGATRSAGNETPITVALAKDSPRHTSGNDADVLLFDFPGFGIDRTAVALGSVPSRTDGFYYVDDASATPAQLWVHCEPHGATVLILQ